MARLKLQIGAVSTVTLESAPMDLESGRVDGEKREREGDKPWVPVALDREGGCMFSRVEERVAFAYQGRHPDEAFRGAAG